MNVKQGIFKLLMTLALLAGSPAAPSAPMPLTRDPLASNSQPATSKEVDEIQSYARALGREWMSRILGLDLFAIEQDLKRRTQEFTSVSAEGSKPEIGGREATWVPPTYVLRLDFEQYDDINRIRLDPWDIPFAFKLNAQRVLVRNFLELKTEAFVPLSWKDELRVKAEMPVTISQPGWLKDSLRYTGFTSAWTLRVMWGNRLGQNLMEWGAGTLWRECWDVNWFVRQRFGQGLSEHSQWVKIGLVF